MKIKLYKAFEHWTKFDNIWVFSDPHFDDPDCKFMNPNWPSSEEIVKNINSKVGKRDMIIFLGDIGKIKWIRQIKGYKVLITGNHDVGVSKYKREIDEEVIDLEDLYHADSRHPEVVCNDETIDLRNNLLNEYRRNLLNKYKNRHNFSHLSDIYEDRFYHCCVKALFDNHLFDEVYDGPIFINDKILLSHEPIGLPFCINVHGHCHGKPSIGNSINMCADVNEFTPKRLDYIIKSIKVDSIHRFAIDRAIERKYCNECKK